MRDDGHSPSPGQNLARCGLGAHPDFKLAREFVAGPANIVILARALAWAAAYNYLDYRWAVAYKLCAGGLPPFQWTERSA